MTVVLEKRKGGVRIVGSGGGGKGGGGSARTPVEHPDSLHNTSYAAILDLIGNGELAGPVHPDQPLRDIYLNGTPIQNADGSLNFNQVQSEYRVGTVDQEHISGFPAVSSITSVGAEVKTTQPFSQLLTNPDLSAVRVSIYAPQLVQVIESGSEAMDRAGVVVEYAIDLAIGSGSFKEVVRSSLDGKTVNGYTRTHRIELPKTQFGWTFRVRRITPDSTNSSVTDKIAVQSYAEVIDGKFRYPMSALVGIKIDAEQFQSIPTRAYHWRGKIIRVPSNYNPETRTYSGAWNGQFKRAWSDNPAWIYYDVLTSRLSGLGDRIEAHMIDRYALYQIGAYCDQLVSDGQGGKEPRFRMGLLYIQSQEDALRVLNDLTSVFRGMSYWANGQVVAVADMPSDPVYTYANANVIDGVIEYTGTDLSTRKTVALVSWNDPTDFYRSKVEVVEDEEGIRRYGIRKAEVVAFGCTSRGQAQRVGLYHLYTSRMETGAVSFSVGLDGVIPQPGSIVKIADRNRAGRHVGGRIREATTTVITLDREHPVKAGDSLTVNLPNGKPETRTVSLVTGRVVRVRSAFSVAPASESVWAVEAPDLVMQHVRVISVRERDAVTYEVAGVLHHPGKYSAIDDGVRLDPLPISVIPARTQDAPKNIKLSTYYIIKEGASKHTLVITWDKAKGASRYEVQFRRNNSNWVSLPQTGSTSIEVDNVYSGLYEARVRAINALDVPSLWAYGAATELDGLVGEPPWVTSLTTEGVPWGINLRWGFSSEPNIIGYSEVRYGPSSDFNDSSVLGQYAYPTNNFAHQGLKIDAEFFYWVRLLDKNGVAGAWYPYENQPGIRGTPSQAADEYNDLITKEILESALGQQLFDDIESIEDLWQTLAELGIDVDRLGIQVTEVDGKFVVVNSRLDSMNNRFTGLEVEIDAITAQVSELAGTATWDPEQAYLTGQIVKFNGALYRAIQDVPANTPVFNTGYWEKVGNFDSINDLVTSLAARMTAAEIGIDELTGVVTAHASEITQLQSSVTNLEEEVEGNATAIDQLETSVIDINGQLEVTSKQTTVLAATLRRLDDGEGELDTAMAAFENRAFIKETQEVVANNEKAVAKSILEIGARIDHNVALISEVKESVVTLDSAQAQVNQSLAAQVQDNASTIGTVQTVIADLESSQATVNSELMSQVGSNAAKITGIQTTMADDKQAQASINQGLQSQLTDVDGKASGTATALTTLNTKVTSIDGRVTAQATQINQVESKANGTSATVQDLSKTVTSIDGKVQATRTIKVAVNSGGTQYMAGIGVGVDNSTGGMQSQVVVVAGRFSVMHSTTGSPQAVFSVQGGTSILNSAIIGTANIDTLHLKGQAVTFNVGLHQSSKLNVPTSGSYVMSSTINCSGAPVNVHISFFCRPTGDIDARKNTSHAWQARVWRNGQVIYTGWLGYAIVRNTNTYGWGLGSVSFNVRDTPGAGNATYTVEIYNSEGDNGVTVYQRSMILSELKR